MRSTQEEQFTNRWIGWDINSYNPYEEATTSILAPLFVLASFFHHDFDLALKSPSTNNYGKIGLKSTYVMQ